MTQFWYFIYFFFFLQPEQCPSTGWPIVVRLTIADGNFVCVQIKKITCIAGHVIGSSRVRVRITQLRPVGFRQLDNRPTEFGSSAMERATRVFGLNSRDWRATCRARDGRYTRRVERDHSNARLGPTAAATEDWRVKNVRRLFLADGRFPTTVDKVADEYTFSSGRVTSSSPSNDEIETRTRRFLSAAVQFYSPRRTKTERHVLSARRKPKETRLIKPKHGSGRRLIL